MAENSRLLQDGKSLLRGIFPSIVLGDTYVEVVYSDYCEDFSHEFLSWKTKWGLRGLLFCESDLGVPYDFDWGDQSRITICPWESVLELRCVGLGKCLATASQAVLKSHASSARRTIPAFPIAYGAIGELILICPGNPRSERSAKGKRKPKETVAALLPEVKRRFPKPLSCPFEVFVETFVASKCHQPDIDRAIPPILDAFGGVVYEDDRQVANIHHRVFQISNMFVTLHLESHPTIALAEITSIPIGSLAPLIWGEIDYHVIRLNALT